jgi:Amidase
MQDMYDMKGKRTTMAFIAWYDRIPSEDSSMVKILRDAGGMLSSQIYCLSLFSATSILNRFQQLFSM